MSEEVDTITDKRVLRASNRLGLSELDEEGAVWLSSGKTYSCTGSAHSDNSNEQ